MLLERGLVLLVDNNQSQPLEGQEQRRTGTKNHLVGIGGKLFLPYLHALGIRVFRVVNAQQVAKHLLQAVHHLYGQRYLGQQIKHLLFLLESLTDEVDIHFGLAARRHAVKQHHILAEKLEENLIVSLLLGRTEWFGTLKMRFAAIVQASHLALVSNQELPVNKTFDGRRRAMAAVHQLVARNLDGLLTTHVTLDGVPMRERQIVNEGFLLAGGTRQHVERHMECLLILQPVGQTNI